MNDHLEHFFSALEKNAALYAPSVRDHFTRDPEAFSELGSLILTWAFELLGEDCYDILAQGYSAFVSDVNRCQSRYQRSGSYPNHSYKEVYEAVYNNPSVMKDYHWGVYVTTFAWDHHLKLYKLFRDAFLSELPKEAKILDLGSGSGIWSLLIAHHLPQVITQGFDISETSVTLAQNLCRVSGLSDRVKFDLGDALVTREPVYDAGISCFLLEHLEDPQMLLNTLAAQLKPGGWAWVTGALTAAETDHIYEFRRESELIQLAELAGFRVVQSRSLGPTNYPRRYKFLPRSMGMLLQKRQHHDVW